MTKSYTKATAIAELNARTLECNTLREQLERERADRIYYQEQFKRAEYDLLQLRDAPAKPAKPVPEMPAWQLERKAKMEAAREAAMKMRCMIKV